MHRLGLFSSFRTLELVTDSVDVERVALSRHRMTRLLAPWTQEVGGARQCCSVDLSVVLICVLLFG
jgi:hypothetical protein